MDIKTKELLLSKIDKYKLSKLIKHYDYILDYIKNNLLYFYGKTALEIHFDLPISIPIYIIGNNNLKLLITFFEKLYHTHNIFFKSFKTVNLNTTSIKLNLYSYIEYINVKELSLIQNYFNLKFKPIFR